MKGLEVVVAKIVSGGNVARPNAISTSTSKQWWMSDRRESLLTVNTLVVQHEPVFAHPPM